MKNCFAINVISCGVGGAIQVATGFIRHAYQCLDESQTRLLILTNPDVFKECGDCHDSRRIEWVVFENKPSSFFYGIKVRRMMIEAVRKSGASAVFTVFGPSYVKFPVPELTGFAVGFIMTPTRDCYSNHPFIDKCKQVLINRIKLFALRSSDEYWVETETARQGLAHRLSIDPAKIHVVLNGVNELIISEDTSSFKIIPGRILLMGAGYWHKNHAIISMVANELQKKLPGQPWHFAVTLPSDSRIWTSLSRKMASMGLSHRLVNLGKLRIAECARAYAECEVVFHPSLLETFSATYVEAMAMHRPLVVSDRSFAREICEDAAVYFEPRDPLAAAQALASVLRNSELVVRLVSTGEIRCRRFPDAAAKNGKLFALATAFARRAAAKAAAGASINVS